MAAGVTAVNQTIDGRQLRRMLDDGGEIALIDVREEGIFARDGHLLLASNVPSSHLEMRMPALVPRRTTRVVVCDGGEGLAARAVQRLAEHGYSSLGVLAGGTPAWAAAGGRLYTGQYVPSKAFGEYVHHHDRPPEVSADELAAWKRAGRDLLILDSRPLDEYRRKTIPGSIDCPSAELAYRVHDLVRTPETTVVVNCGGRTRAIIGAQALINAGLPNKVCALKDGTQGWHLAGYPLDVGRTDHAPPPSPRGLAQARAAAERVAARYAIRRIDRAGLRLLQSEPDRTVYVLDVRTPEEYAAGHLAGSIHAPGGQLVQATDTWLAVRHASVVLVDNDGARATMTASWLVQMGWTNVHVLAGAFAEAELVRGSQTSEVLGIEKIAAPAIGPRDLARLLEADGATVIDFASSLDYREGHVPGAWHAVRSRLAADLGAIPAARLYVATSPDGVLARLACADIAAATAADAQYLAGGTSTWRAAGLPLEQGAARLAGPADDIKYRALDQAADVEKAIREYLQWEVNLLHATESDPDLAFRRFA